MPAGTIAVTNGSATVTGSGTSFSTELKVNDFIAVTVGGVVETLGVQSIASNTSLTLVKAFTGPTTSGLSWTPIPAGTMVGITAQIAAQVSYAIRGLNLDKVNWQQVLTGTGNVTVNLADGLSFTGPAWGGIASSLSSINTALSNKANSSDVLTKADNLAGVSNKTAALSNLGALPLSGGSMTGGITMSGSAGINLSSSNLTNINVMSWITSAAARASMAAAGFNGTSSSGNGYFDIVSTSRIFRVMYGTAVVSLNSSGEATVPYPAAFPSAVCSVMICLGDNTGATSLSVINFSQSRVGNFDVHAWNQTNSACRINFISIGY